MGASGRLASIARAGYAWNRSRGPAFGCALFPRDGVIRAERDGRNEATSTVPIIKKSSRAVSDQQLRVRKRGGLIKRKSRLESPLRSRATGQGGSIRFCAVGPYIVAIFPTYMNLRLFSLVDVRFLLRSVLTR